MSRLLHALALAATLAGCQKAQTPAIVENPRTEAVARTGAGRPGKNIVLWYLAVGDGNNARATPLTADEAAPLVTYQSRDKQALRWNFDGVLLGAVDLNFSPPTAKYEGHRVGPAHARKFLNAVYPQTFDTGPLEILEHQVAAHEAALGAHRLDIYFWIPCVTTDLEGTCADAPTWITALTERFAADATRWPHLRLAGFYWGYREFIASDKDKNMIVTAAAAVRRQPAPYDALDVLWIPSYANRVETLAPDYWHGIGLTRVIPQPNYRYPDGDLGNLAQVSSLISSRSLAGGEVEVGTASLRDPVEYIKAYMKYGWRFNDLNAFYYGQPIARFANSADATNRSAYDAMVCAMAGGTNCALVAPRLGLTVRGTGSVTGPSLSCSGGDCGETYPPGEIVSLIAHVPNGGQLISWDGCETTSGAGNTICGVKMNGARAVTATFKTLPRTSLVVTGAGRVTGAGVSCTAGAVCYPGGTPGVTASLTAQPAVGHILQAWEGCKNTSGAGSLYCAFPLDGRTVRAVFK